MSTLKRQPTLLTETGGRVVFFVEAQADRLHELHQSDFPTDGREIHEHITEHGALLERSVVLELDSGGGVNDLCAQSLDAFLQKARSLLDAVVDFGARVERTQLDVFRGISEADGAAPIVLNTSWCRLLADNRGSLTVGDYVTEALGADDPSPAPSIARPELAGWLLEQLGGAKGAPLGARELLELNRSDLTDVRAALRELSQLAQSGSVARVFMHRVDGSVSRVLWRLTNAHS